jgi:hypothetical protein
LETQTAGRGNLMNVTLSDKARAEIQKKGGRAVVDLICLSS